MVDDFVELVAQRIERFDGFGEQLPERVDMPQRYGVPCEIARANSSAVYTPSRGM